MTMHSKLPWGYETHELSTGYSSIVYDANGYGVPGMSHLNEGDARIIVTAVNSHDRLLAAAKGIQRLSKTPFPPDDVDVGSNYKAIDDAIAAVEEPH